ncbi:unnamed protein product [Onchocerca flexuosa]|uniref:CASPASE_P10 domain-containing protein n=1 Tax=Onchocerca flexuosa TaxID=387005 RepID=A0A183HRU6_9BILA|nr:unnamed protein product [Onchocerca flexuosa]
MHDKKTKAYGFPSTSDDTGDSIEQGEDDVVTIEDLNTEEKALVDQVLVLCSQFIRGINCADVNWYSKLKMAIFLRLQQLVENMKNAVTRRRELRERNEELCRLRQHLIERNRINEPECACEKILPDPTIKEFGPQHQNSFSFIQSEFHAFSS